MARTGTCQSASARFRARSRRMRPWTPPRRKLKIPWEATPVQVRVLPSALRRARPRRDRVRARRRRDRVVDDQVDGHAYAPPMQPGRPAPGFEDPVLAGLVERRVGALHDPDRRGLKDRKSVDDGWQDHPALNP